MSVSTQMAQFFPNMKSHAFNLRYLKTLKIPLTNQYTNLLPQRSRSQPPVVHIQEIAILLLIMQNIPKLTLV